jgi:hypothetical protein
VLGPKLFHHVRCCACRTEYNGKTGKSNTTAIAIYVGIGLVVGLTIGLLVGVMLFKT